MNFIKKFFIILLLCISSIIFILPMVITISNSFMSQEEINEVYSVSNQENVESDLYQQDFINMKLIPDEVSIDQYYSLLIKKNNYLNMFWNSVIIVVPITIGHIIISLMAAYTFSLSKVKYKDGLFFIYIVVMLMPYQVTLVPNYIIAEKFKLIGSYFSIILPGIFSTSGVFLLRQYMKNIPNAYIEAAQIDGASFMEIFIHIIFPLSKTAIASLAILTFIDNWNMVEQALVFLKSVSKQPLSVYLYTIAKEEKGITFAASVFYMSPMLLMFLYCENYLVEGIQNSGIKG